MATPSERRPNRLAGETSPYLLQHAHNPVDWYPWGEEALARAKAEDRPILLSIGYSACHWCHVMERESFEDERIAGLMNEAFVCVKVDREERPDLDEIYMQATLAMNSGQGGWPMTVFLTPDLEPLFAGTYFPPDDRYGRPGFPAVLTGIARAWCDSRSALVDQAARLTAYLREAAAAAPPPAGVGKEAFALALDQLRGDFDPRWGGFGGAPKFPPATAVRLLLRLHARSGDEDAATMARLTLERMAQGGLHDHLGGGFSRYSVDERWHVPHFEKMLYDNALLAVAYLEGFQATGDERFARVAAGALDWAIAEMTTADGAFASATDADSEGEEGKYFAWTAAELAALLPADEAAAAAAFWNVTGDGNWEEGKSVLHTPLPEAVVAGSLGLDLATFRVRIAAARARLLAARAERVPPGRDDKVLCGWNGLMIGALARGFEVLGERRFLDAAFRAADFLLPALFRDGRLLRAYRAGRARHDGVLEDYAYLAEGLVALFEAGGRRADLGAATALGEAIVERFADRERGGFFHTGEGHERLLVRFREGSDGATPAPNAAAASALARLAVHLGRDDFRAAAAAAIRAWGEPLARWPRAFAASLLVADFLAEGPIELVFVGRPGDPGLAALRRAAARAFVPARLETIGDPDDPASLAGLPLFDGRLRVSQATLFVCRGGTCLAPVTDPAAVGAALR